jgi:predicted ArsR family transcriptional regulator
MQAVAISLKEAGLLSLLDSYGGCIALKDLSQIIQDGKDSIKTAINCLVEKGLIQVESITNEGRYAGKQIVKCGKSAIPYILTGSLNTKVSNKGNAENPQNTKAMTEQEYKSGLKRLVGKRLRMFSRSRARKANRSPEQFIDSFVDFCYKDGRNYADNKGSVAGLKQLMEMHCKILGSKPIQPDHSEYDTLAKGIAAYSEQMWKRKVPDEEVAVIRDGLVRNIFNKHQAAAAVFVGARLSEEYRSWIRYSQNKWREWVRLYPDVKDLWSKMTKKPANVEEGQL